MAIYLLIYFTGCFIGHKLVKNHLAFERRDEIVYAWIMIGTLGSWITLIIFVVNYYLTKRDDS